MSKKVVFVAVSLWYFLVHATTIFNILVIVMQYFGKTWPHDPLNFFFYIVWLDFIRSCATVVYGWHERNFDFALL